MPQPPPIPERFPVVAGVAGERRDGAWATGGVRRILVLKLDHIGDLLVGAPALMLLRRSFAEAHVTLVCGPWNVGLARRLGLADEIVPLAFFGQNASEGDPDSRARQRAAAMAELQAKALGPFDLAVDMRRDDDTRELLKLVPARVLAGFGDLETFGYLDVALPYTRHHPPAGPTSLRLGPEDFDNGLGHLKSGRGLHVTARQAELRLELSTDAVWPPSDEGQPDTRLLGAALHRVDVRRSTPDGTLGPAVELARDQLAFGPGWLEGEPWGRWANAASAPVTLRFAAEAAGVEVLARVQGHTGSSHPRAMVAVSCGEARAERLFQDGDEPAQLRLAAQARLSPPLALTRPHLLRPGRWSGVLGLDAAEGQWSPLTLTVRDARGVQTLARLVLPERVEAAGALDVPFAFEHRDAVEPIVIEVSGREGAAPGPAITGLTLECLQARSPPLPVAHMEAQLVDLAAMIAARFAPQVVAGGEEVERRLREARPGSSATAAAERIRARRGGRRVFGLVPPRRVIGIGLGANKETKLWPRPYFVDLCRRLLARRGVDLAFFGGPKEAAETGAVVAELAAGERVLDLCSACRIEDLGEAMAELDGFIGLDTGTTHFAGRVGVATVSLFGAAHDPREWGPVGRRSAWTAVEVPCAGCSKSDLAECGFRLRCMTLLTPGEVWPLIEERLLKAAAEPR